MKNQKIKKYFILSLCAASIQMATTAYGLIAPCTNYISTLDGQILSPIIEAPTTTPLSPIATTLVSDMTKERFIALIDIVTEIYQPSFAKLGAVLTVNKRWDDKNEDIHSDQWANGNWRITMTGGFARNPLITEDGFVMALCHEVGHHLGGAPRYNKNTNWAATEGQSDYFAGLKCFKKYIEKDDNIAIVAKMTIDASVTKECTQAFKTAQEVAMCQRSAIAGFSVANLIASRSETPIIKFNTPDRNQVAMTLEDGPFPQCRLDTFYQGSLCDRPIDEELSKDNPRIGTCNQKDGYKVGNRPRCWYSPSGEI